MMQVVTDEDVYTDSVRVFLFERSPVKRCYTVESGLLVARPVGEGEPMQPLFTINRDQADAVLSALRHGSPELSDALDDARTVRDRLLYIIEKGAK